MTDRGKPLYMIGVVAEMLKVHPAACLHPITVRSR